MTRCLGLVSLVTFLTFLRLHLLSTCLQFTSRKSSQVKQKRIGAIACPSVSKLHYVYDTNSMNHSV